MAQAKHYLKIEGIRATSGDTTYDPLYVPFESEAQIRRGYQESIGQKIGNDPERDLQNFLTTWTLVDSLQGGAWHKHWKPNAFTYYDPNPAPSAAPYTKALAWTLLPEYPIMPGAKHTTKNGSYAFKEMAYFSSTAWGLDVKNKKVWKYVAGTWTEQTSAPDSGTVFTGASVTEIKVVKGVLYVGQGTRGDGKVARYTTDGTSWSNFTETAFDQLGNAQHFTGFGNYLVYSTGNVIRVKGGLPQGAAQATIPSVYDINRLEWWRDKIYAANPEGVWEWDPLNGQILQIFKNSGYDANLGRALAMYGGAVYFNAGNDWFVYQGDKPRLATFFRKDSANTGSNKVIVDGGQVINAWSDGQKLWLILKVTTQDSTPEYHYYVVGFTGEGYHPVLISAATTDPAYLPSAVLIENSRLHYSLGNDKTGYLDSDGNQPTAFDASSDYSISLGYFDASRVAHDKHFKKWHARYWILVGGNYAFQLYYKKIGQSSWSSAGNSDINYNPHGNDEDIDITAETGAQAGIVAKACDFRVRIYTGSSGEPNYIKDLSLIGRVNYPPAFTASVSVKLNMRDTYSITEQLAAKPTTIYNGLKQAMGQAAPIKITFPDGLAKTGTMRPIPDGDRVLEVDPQTGNALDREFLFQFIEDA